MTETTNCFIDRCNSCRHILLGQAASVTSPFVQTGYWDASSLDELSQAKWPGEICRKRVAQVKARHRIRKSSRGVETRISGEALRLIMVLM